MLDLMRDIILATDLAHHLRIFKDLQKMAEGACLPLGLALGVGEELLRGICLESIPKSLDPSLPVSTTRQTQPQPPGSHPGCHIPWTTWGGA